MSDRQVLRFGTASDAAVVLERDTGYSDVFALRCALVNALQRIDQLEHPTRRVAPVLPRFAVGREDGYVFTHTIRATAAEAIAAYEAGQPDATIGTHGVHVVELAASHHAPVPERTDALQSITGRLLYAAFAVVTVTKHKYSDLPAHLQERWDMMADVVQLKARGAAPEPVRVTGARLYEAFYHRAGVKWEQASALSREVWNAAAARLTPVDGSAHE